MVTREMRVRSVRAASTVRAALRRVHLPAAVHAVRAVPARVMTIARAKAGPMTAATAKAAPMKATVMGHPPIRFASR